MRKLRLLAIIIPLILLPQTSEAQLGFLKKAAKKFTKWINNEAIPTVIGKRPLKIDPNRIRISSGGKDILNLDLSKDKVYIDMGIATLKTGKLKQRIFETGAILSGNTAVMEKVAFEQLQKVASKEVSQLLSSGGVKQSPPKHLKTTKERVPSYIRIPPKKIKPKQRDILLFNSTSSSILYVLNGELFELQPGWGNQHFHEKGEFFLQYDNDYTEYVNVARYYLTGKEYALSPNYALDEIIIEKRI
ncbi:hypothetical protein [Tenacibaculum agarivorans]|uniref:hypothetical protein n=1 Tax=Tenacibaculum agarivorans TaxID=1908389 RepID=UPI00094B8E06|nr:hypothetical protein [Tenacibaculum agarivorans]